MKLAIDAQPLLDVQKTGVSWYTNMMTQFICADQSVQLQAPGKSKAKAGGNCSHTIQFDIWQQC